MNIVPIDPLQKVVDPDTGKMTQEMQTWTRLVSETSVIQGDGSPEGVITARTGRLYMNTSGTAGSILYIKRDAAIGGDESQGWILV